MRDLWNSLKKTAIKIFQSAKSCAILPASKNPFGAYKKSMTFETNQEVLDWYEGTGTRFDG